MAAKQITITLTDEDQANLAVVNRTRSYTEKQLLELVVKRGIYALKQRTEYNAKKQVELKGFKEWKASQASK